MVNCTVQVHTPICFMLHRETKEDVYLYHSLSFWCTLQLREPLSLPEL